MYVTTSRVSVQTLWWYHCTGDSANEVPIKAVEGAVPGVQNYIRI